MCLKNALSKSCVHMLDESFRKQASRLQTAGYPTYLIVAVAECLLKESKGMHCNASTNDRPTPENRNVAVVPYIHQVSHNLKKIAARVNTRVVFSAPFKLSKLCKKTNPDKTAQSECSIKHRKPFVQCVTNVVYRIPLSCGRAYIGQTGRCLNVRLGEHCNKVGNFPPDGFLAQHCHGCACKPNFQGTVVVSRNRSEITRLIIEAEQIDYLGDACVSNPSMSLSAKELHFLRMNH